MIKKIITKSANLFNGNRKYFFVLVIFALVLYLNNFGRPIYSQPTTNKDLYEDRSPAISSASVAYEVPLSNIRTGDFYRLVILCKSRPENITLDPSLPLDGQELNNQGLHDSDLKISLVSKTTKKRLIKEIKVLNTLDYNLDQFVFPVDDIYTKLLIEKKDSNDTNQIFLKSIEVMRLDTVDFAQAQATKPYVLGATNFAGAIADISESGDRLLHTFSRKKTEIVGQIFKAESDYLSGVSFSLDVKGKGGYGSYFVELHEVDQVDGKFKVNPSVIEKVEFHAYDPLSFLDQNDEWRFPLVHKLKKGSYYFAGINNDLSRSNRSNYLSVRGYEDGNKYKDGEALLIDDGGNSTILGDLHFRAFDAQYSEYSGERVLTNASIEDLGGGRGYYNYQSAGNFSDYLDLDSFLLPNLAADKVFYNQKERTVLGTAQDNTSFTYKFYAGSLIKNFTFEASQVGESYFNSRVSYSFDNQNWQELENSVATASNENDDSTPIILKKDISVAEKEDQALNFKQSISGNGKSSVVYIRITYDPNDNGKQEGLFGLKNMNLRAELVIK